jgi:hypothetical protein
MSGFDIQEELSAAKLYRLEVPEDAKPENTVG